MDSVNWMSLLGWEARQLEELRITGYAYLRQGKYDIALPFFEALHALDSKNLYDLQTLGALHVQLGNPAKAMHYLDQSIKLQPKHPESLLNLAKAFIMMGNTEDGLKIARTLQKHPNREIANVAKALLLAFS